MCSIPFSLQLLTSLKIFYNVIASVSLFYNMTCIIVIFARKVHLHSALATHIIRNQFILDFFVVFNLLIILNQRFDSGNNAIIDQIVCYLWNSQFPYWTMVAVSINNLTENCIDRVCAVRWAIMYKASMKLRFRLYYGLLFTLPILISFPIIFDTKYINNVCVDRNLNASHHYLIFQKFFAGFWFCCTFIIPSAISLFSFFVIYHVMHNTSKPGGEISIRKSEIRYTVVTFITDFIFIVSFGVESILYLMKSFDGICYEKNDPLQHLVVVLGSVSSMINPLVCNMMLKNFRSNWINFWCGCISKRYCVAMIRPVTSTTI